MTKKPRSHRQRRWPQYATTRPSVPTLPSRAHPQDDVRAGNSLKLLLFVIITIIINIILLREFGPTSGNPGDARVNVGSERESRTSDNLEKRGDFQVR